MFGPSLGKQSVIFVDDLNMPQVGAAAVFGRATVFFSGFLLDLATHLSLAALYLALQPAHLYEAVL